MRRLHQIQYESPLLLLRQYFVWTQNRDKQSELYIQGVLTDRQGVSFYLNVLDIPAKPENKDSGSAEVNNNYLQLAVRSRIKFFFRPDDLKITPNDAYQKSLGIRRVRDVLKQLTQLRIT